MKNIERKYIVYMHINTINDKKYIGITSLKRINNRWHSDGSGYRKQIFGKAIQKYGWDKFEHIILEKELSEEEAFQKEKEYILLYKTTNPKYGYNISSGGEGSPGILNNSLSVPVYMYSLNGDFIKKFPSMMEAERETGISNSLICSCCKKKHSYTKEYQWSYEYLDKMPPVDKKILRYEANIKNQEKIVYQYNDNGDLINIYKSLTEAGKRNNISFKSISECCLGKIKSSHGYRWFYEYQGEKIEPYIKRKRTIT